MISALSMAQEKWANSGKHKSIDQDFLVIYSEPKSFDVNHYASGNRARAVLEKGIDLIQTELKLRLYF